MDIKGLERKIKAERETVEELHGTYQKLFEKLIGQPTCCFCEKELELDMFGNMYRLCDCDDAKSALKTLNEHQRKYEKESLELIRLETQYRNSVSKRNGLKERSGMGKRTQSHTFANFNPEKCQDAYQKAQAFVECFEKNNEGRGMIIFGNSGIGKTHLVAAVANEIIERYDTEVSFEVGTSMFTNLLLATIPEKKEYINRLKNIPLLILDDMGKEKVSEWNRSTLFDIVNYRYDNMLPTIITSNLNLAELETALTAEIYSRLCETCEIIYMRGKDNRR